MNKNIISDSYRNLNKLAHEDPEFGTNGDDIAQIVADYIKECDFKTVLDYGAGKQRLTLALRTLTDARVDAYDPSIPEIETVPLNQYEFVICRDVMEHIEPDFLNQVLEHQAALTTKLCWHATSRTPAKRTLPDGRNAHLIVESHQWWIEQVSDYFEILRDEVNESHSFFWLGPQGHATAP